MDRVVSVARVDRLVPVARADRLVPVAPVVPDGASLDPAANPAALTANDRYPKNRTLPKTVWPEDGLAGCGYRGVRSITPSVA